MVAIIKSFEIKTLSYIKIHCLNLVRVLSSCKNCREIKKKFLLDKSVSLCNLELLVAVKARRGEGQQNLFQFVNHLNIGLQICLFLDFQEKILESL